MKTVFKGWTAFFILTNISFYAVKRSIDNRRKEEYLKALELENSTNL
jgi:hypothetical protein